MKTVVVYKCQTCAKPYFTNIVSGKHHNRRPQSEVEITDQLNGNGV